MIVVSAASAGRVSWPPGTFTTAGGRASVPVTAGTTYKVWLVTQLGVVHSQTFTP